MANYQGLILQSSETGQVSKVFLIRTEPNTGIPRDALLAIQIYAHEKFNQSLTPIDLEVVELDRLKERVRAMNKGR